MSFTHSFVRIHLGGCALFLSIAMQTAIQAATITVTSAGDTDAVDGFVTLKEAIYSANSNGNWNADVVAVGVYGTDTINFNIAGTGVHTITTHLFPAITGPTVVDGYSQPGASPNTLAVGNNAVLLIELDASSEFHGLELAGSGSNNSTIRGLVINRAAFEGIALVNSSNNVIEGNFIGTDPTGSLNRGNQDGIGVGGSNNLIGGTVPAARNIISSNDNTGVTIQGTGTIIRGNYIGTDKNGVAPLGNYNGIFAEFGQNTVIGASDADDGVIDGLVGGRNVISGNNNVGIFTRADSPPPTSAVTIMGNFIGLDASGSAPLGNSAEGIRRDDPNLTGGLTVGGTAAGAGNVISANGNSGISNDAPGLVIQGNFIGTDASGTVDLGNGGFGIVSVDNGTNGIIGGSMPGARNVISGNDNSGIDIRAAGHTIQGNFIGTQIDGVSPLGNEGSGIAMQNTSGTIGGPSAGEGNIIAYNSHGVFVYGATSHVSILGNSIFSNLFLGLDLTLDGVTLNDTGDADTGANSLQNFPVLTSMSSSGGSTTIAGTLNSVANTIYRLEFFASAAVHSSGYGEGQSFIGFATVTTDSNGNASFNLNVPQIPAGWRVTATATDPNGNTSEFSAAIGQLLNISTRSQVETGDNVMICGFIVTGTDPKRVLLRGMGPSLAPFFPDFLPDPSLELHGPAGFVTIINDNWKIRPDGSSQQAEIEATGIPPANDLESALLQSLPANNAAYTAILRDQNADTGTGLIEAYDLDAAANSKLANISTRAFVETGNRVLIGGFIAGHGVTKVIIRAIGPSLEGVGVAEALPNPTLELHNSDGALLASNDNWRTTQEAEIIATTIPPANDLESAIVITLTPGAYTAIVAGANNTTGVGLVEVYNIQ